MAISDGAVAMELTTKEIEMLELLTTVHLCNIENKLSQVENTVYNKGYNLTKLHVDKVVDLRNRCNNLINTLLTK